MSPVEERLSGDFRDCRLRTTLTISPYNKRTSAVREPTGGLEDEPSVRPLWEDRLPDGESQLPGQGEHFSLEIK